MLVEDMKKVLKEKTGFDYTSEQIFDIEEAPEHTCPEFASVIKSISYAENAIYKGLQTDEIDTMENFLNDADYSLNGIIRQLEDLNEQVEYLRNWGQQWKYLAKYMIENYNVPLDEISGLWQLQVEGDK